jgi:hypothetical protein
MQLAFGGQAAENAQIDEVDGARKTHAWSQRSPARHTIDAARTVALSRNLALQKGLVAAEPARLRAEVWAT